ncbi:hypothetical protein LW139_13595 [Proteus vulgaris]|uniref:hypothetical protein n=1 Tax=Proteus TaxID=583 RepID=UPI001D0B26BC|nr:MULTISPECIES: hypothetical protein [Proteus]UDN34759.1 hypothetical protein LG402_13460 [Proteus sp. NMG38-2]UPK79859.1 hypothetical protein LW139_13595 [Proteus vulgaris]
MKNFFKISLLTSAILFLSACDQVDLDNKKNKFYYSNPSENMISFSVDGKEYQVEPGKNGYITLSPGEHNLKDSAGNNALFMIYDNNNGGILNPDNFMYYTLSEVYAVKGKTDQFKTVDYPLIINGYEFELPVRSTNATLIDGNTFQCTYPLGEPFPNEIRTRNKNNDGGIKNKCFDKPEFIKYISAEYAKDLNPFTQEDEYNDSVNLNLDYMLPTAEFTDPDIQAEAEELVSLLNQIQESEDPKIHNALKDKLYKATLAVSNAYANRAVKDSVEDNKYYTRFIEASGQFQSYGILPKD